MMWFVVYLKELKDSFRDRKTIILSVIIPIMFNIGIVFFMDQFFLQDKSADTIHVAITEQADVEVVNWLQAVDHIELMKDNDPTSLVKAGDALVAIEVDQDFTSLLAEGKSPQITLYTDSASMKGATATETISSIFTLKQQEITADRLSEANVSMSIIEPFEIAHRDISGEDDGGLYLVSILAQLVIVFAILMGGLPAASDLFAGEKERKTMEALIMTPVNRIHILIGKWLTIASLGMISGLFSIVTLVTFVQLFTSKLKDALNLSDNIVFFISSMSVGIVVFALLVAALQMVLSLLAKDMKEAQNYVSPVMMISMIPYFLLIGTSPHELTNVHFIIPFMNIFALIKQLIYGVYDFSSILLVAGSSVVFIAITIGIGMVMFSKSKWVLGDA